MSQMLRIIIHLLWILKHRPICPLLLALCLVGNDSSAHTDTDTKVGRCLRFRRATTYSVTVSANKGIRHFHNYQGFIHCCRRPRVICLSLSKSFLFVCLFCIIFGTFPHGKFIPAADSDFDVHCLALEESMYVLSRDQPVMVKIFRI